MNESEFQPEPYEELSPLRRYYSDMHYKAHSFIDMRIAAEKYVVSSGMAQTEDEAMWLVDTVLPTFDYGEIMSKSEIADMLTTLPLLLGGHYVDTHMNIRDASEWYESTLKTIRKKQRKVHNITCLESPYFAFTQATCLESNHCPVITVSKYVDLTIFDSEEDMKGEVYMIDPLSMRDIAIMKQRTAASYEFEDPTAADFRIRHYQERFDKVFPFNN